MKFFNHTIDGGVMWVRPDYVPTGNDPWVHGTVVACVTQTDPGTYDVPGNRVSFMLRGVPQTDEMDTETALVAAQLNVVNALVVDPDDITANANWAWVGVGRTDADCGICTKFRHNVVNGDGTFDPVTVYMVTGFDGGVIYHRFTDDDGNHVDAKCVFDVWADFIADLRDDARDDDDDDAYNDFCARFNILM